MPSLPRMQGKSAIIVLTSATYHLPVLSQTIHEFYVGIQIYSIQMTKQQATEPEMVSCKGWQE